MTDNKFTPPKDIDDAIARKQAKVDELENIEEQLAIKNRTHEDGRRYTAEEYWEWHRKANHAKLSRLKEIRCLKDYIRAANVKFNEARAGYLGDGLNPSDKNTPAVAAMRLLHELAKEVTLKPEEQSVVDAFDHFVKKMISSVRERPKTMSLAK